MKIGNKIQQCNQNKESRLSLVGYAIWKSNTKSVAWVNLDIGIHSDLSLVFSYSNQIILYKACMPVSNQF